MPQQGLDRLTIVAPAVINANVTECCETRGATMSICAVEGVSGRRLNDLRQIAEGFGNLLLEQACMLRLFAGYAGSPANDEQRLNSGATEQGGSREGRRPRTESPRVAIRWHLTRIVDGDTGLVREERVHHKRISWCADT